MSLSHQKMKQLLLKLQGQFGRDKGIEAFAHTFNAGLGNYSTQTFGVKEAVEEARNLPAINPDEVDIQALAAVLISDVLEEARFSKRGAGEGEIIEFQVGESYDPSGAVNSAAFLNITGNVVLHSIWEGYRDEAFTISPRVGRFTTRSTEGGKFEAGLQNPPRLQTGYTVNEAEAYKRVQFGERWLEFPALDQFDLGIELTDRALLRDMTGDMTNKARSVGRIIAREAREIPAMKLLLGLVNNYKYNGTDYNTYSTTGTGSAPDGDWINDISSNPLVDWTDLDAITKLFAALKDPATGLPTDIEPNQIIVMKSKAVTASRIMSATETRSTSGSNETIAGNPFRNRFESIESKLAQHMLENANSQFGFSGGDESTANAADFYFVGNLMEFMVFAETVGLEVRQLNQANDMAFRHRIKAAWAASYYGVPVIKEPRAMVRSYGATTIF